MKKEYIIIVIIVIVVIGLLIFLHGFRRKNKSMEIKDIISFHFSYSKGYMANANIIYEFYYDKDESKYMVSVKPYLIADEEKVVKEAPNELQDKIKNLITKYNLDKWNGFKKYDKNVLDGDNFSFHVRMSDDNLIDADGYMMWPDNYRIVCDEFDKLFMKIYNDEKEFKDKK